MSSKSKKEDSIKKPVTRVARACDSCRKQKMRCQGAEAPPCLRCKTANIPCTFEKPARESQAIGEAGLERIRSLEVQVSSMSANLYELVNLFRTSNKEPTVVSPSAYGGPGSLSNTAWPSNSDQLSQKRPIQPLRHPPQPGTQADHQQMNVALPSSQHHLQPPSTLPSPRNSSKRQYFHSTVTSAASSDDEEELPSSALVAPIEVLRGLADAAAERAATEAKEQAKKSEHPAKLQQSTTNTAQDNPVDVSRKREIDSNHTGRYKRRKKADPPHAYADVVTKGIISEATARELFKTYFEECHKFLPLFDPAYDTYEELRKRSPFCVTVICMVAARVWDGGSPPSRTYVDCQREARDIAKNSMFLQMTRKEAVQALLLFSAFQDNSWLVGGHAVRVAYEVGLDKAIPKLVRRQNKVPKSPPDEDERQIVAAVRIWLCLYIHEQQLSFGTGRTAFLRDDRGTLSHSRILLNHPLATPTDLRLISTMELLQIREKVHNELQPFDTRVDGHTFATLRLATVEFDSWFNNWKEHIQDLQLESILNRVEILADLLSKTPASRYGRSLKLMLNRSMRQATPSELGKASKLPPVMRVPMSATGGSTTGETTNNNAPMTTGIIQNPADTTISDNVNWGILDVKQEQPWSPAFLNGIGIDTSTSTPTSQSTFTSDGIMGPGFSLPMTSSGELPLWLQETNLGDLGVTNTDFVSSLISLTWTSMSKEGSSTLFISNLPFSLTNESLLTAFSDVGPVKSAFVVADHETKESKGVGYVTYAMREDAVAASTEMNGKLITGEGNDKRKCRVEWARQRATLKERKEQAKDNELSNVLGEKTQKQRTRKVSTAKDPDAIRTVVLSGLPTGVTQKEIYKKVRKIGNVESVDLKDDDIAHVKFETPSIANKALPKLHAHIFKGKTISAVLLKRLETAVSGKGKVSRRSRLIVRNLNFNITRDDLKATFIPFGDIHSITLPTIEAKDGSLHNKGYGFVWYTFYHDAQKAIDGMNGKSVKMATSEADVAAAGGTKKQRKKIAKDIEARPIAVDWALSKDQWENEQKAEEKDEKADEKDDEKMEDASDKSDESGSEDEEEEEENEDQSPENSEIDDDEIMEELENESGTEESGDEDDEEEAKAPPLEDGLTLFVRNIPFEATQEDLYEVFRKFGKLRYARVTMDYETERSRGNGFVAFWNMKDAQECLKTAEIVRATTGTNQQDSMKQNPFQTSSILTADPTSKSAQRLTLQGRVLDVIKAVSRDEAVEKKEEGDKIKHKKDKRNVYLIREGVIFPNSPAGSTLSEADQERRMKSFNARRKLLESNPSLYISKTRLSIRQIPLFVTDRVLKRLALHAVKEFEVEVSRGDREALSREELEDMTESEGVKDPKKGYKGRPTAVVQSKIVRQTDRVDSVTGLGRSRGYGFLEMSNHKNALRVLRYANNNNEVTNLMKIWLVEELEQAQKRHTEAIATAKGEKKDEERAKLKSVQERLEKAKGDQLKESRGTLMVEFSIENVQVIKRRAEKAEAIRNRALKRKAAEEDESEEEEEEEEEKPQKKSKKDGKPANKKEDENDTEKSKLGNVIGRKRKERKKRKGGA
ncbi:hypothetical protein E3Q06_01607 [Wallemia mellicola]|nr:hypothetical protein E3Q07_01687 [Wallemia mellicola]TIC50019.1 hypothetical protein E3Q06_01607 [Wallemia mellicola]